MGHLYNVVSAHRQRKSWRITTFQLTISLAHDIARKVFHSNIQAIYDTMEVLDAEAHIVPSI